MSRLRRDPKARVSAWADPFHFFIRPGDEPWLSDDQAIVDRLESMWQEDASRLRVWAGKQLVSDAERRVNPAWAVTHEPRDAAIRDWFAAHGEVISDG